MKIAMIGHKRIPSREGGIEVVVEELSTRMVNEGHTIHAYNRKGHHISGKKFDEKNNGTLKEYRGIRLITVPTFKNGKLNAVVYSFLATIRALFGRYDVIHFHAEGPCSMIWLPHLFGIKTIATIHGLDWQRSKWSGFAKMYLKFGEKVAAKYADEVIVLSKNVQQYFLNTYGRSTRYIPNGIEKPEIENDTVIKEKFGLEKDGYILFLARIVPEKGLHYLIDAYKRINTEKKLVIAGGSSNTNIYMNEIKRMAKEDARVIMTNFVQGEVLQELYSNAYLYVLPSDIEGMPISLLEAMSYGNCCLISDIPENTEVVEDKAVSFKKSNIKDLIQKLNWLIENPNIVENYKKISGDYICTKYDWDNIVEKTIELYNNNENKELSDVVNKVSEQ